MPIGSRTLSTTLQLVVLATIAAACASTRQMTSLPKEGSAGDVVVLFRVAADEDGRSVPSMLSRSPRWTWHLQVNVGPTSHPLSTGRTFSAGQLDAAAQEAGWGFVTLPPGSYQLAFAAYRTRFTMPGAQRGALGFGQSQASELEVPRDAGLLYIGTFRLTCQRLNRWWAYAERECMRLEIRDEETLAREVVTASLGRFGTLRTELALTR
jgi:hypothetical protein